MNKEHKILLINFGGIGDEILFLPTISALRKLYKDSIITLALEPRSASVMQLTQDIDETITVDIKKRSKFWGLLKLLFKAWQEKYDMVISSGANKAIPILLFMMGVKKRYGYNSGSLSKILLTKAVTLNKQQYAAAMYYDLISDLTQEKMQLPEISLEDISKIPNSVLIHPGVSKMSIEKKIYKAPNAEFWSELVEKLLSEGKKVILSGGGDDAEIIGKILTNLKEKGLSDNENFRNIYGKTTSLKDLARRIKEAEVMVCSDSAPMHIGVGVGTKIVALFGPTDEKKLLPVSENFKAAYVNCGCRPCLWDKAQQSCSERFCLNFNVEEVLELIQQQFSQVNH